MDDTADRGPLAQRLAWACALLALLVVASSAYLRLHASSVACVPWPQCQAAAPAVGAPAVDASTAAARLLHRMAAGVMLVLVMLLAGVAHRGPRQRALLARALLGVVVALALLGAFTAGSRHGAVTLGNLLGGFSILGLGAALAAREEAPARLPAWLAALLAVQVLAGGVTSVSHAVWIAGWSALVWLHAAVAVLLLAGVAVACRRQRPGRARSWALAGLLGLQLALGVLMTQPAAPPLAAWLHNLGAALLLVAIVLPLPARRLA